MKIIEGRVHLFGDNIDTDQIYPGRFLDLSDHSEIALHAMEGIRPGFAKEIKPGDIVVAGHNFGCGSSREHAVITLKKSGIGAVVAKSFARIFYRNAVNMALPVIEIAEIPFEEKEKLKMDLEKGLILREDGTSIGFSIFPKNIMAIYKAGGVINYQKSKRKEGN